MGPADGRARRGDEIRDPENHGIFSCGTLPPGLLRSFLNAFFGNGVACSDRDDWKRGSEAGLASSSSPRDVDGGGHSSTDAEPDLDFVDNDMAMQNIDPRLWKGLRAVVKENAEKRVHEKDSVFSAYADTT